MGLKALLYAYVIGGLTFIPLLIAGFIFITIYTSVPVGELDAAKKQRGELEKNSLEKQDEKQDEKDGNTEATSLESPTNSSSGRTTDVNDLPKARKGWLTMRRTFEEQPLDGGYVGLVRNFLDARSKDPKRSRPRDMWYVVLKGKVLFLYEDESMSECEAAIELSGHDVLVYPEELPDGELFAKRNSICLRPKPEDEDSKNMPSVTKQMKLETPTGDTKSSEKKAEAERKVNEVREEAFNRSTPWFIFVRSNVEMEDWYHALIHASDQPAHTPTLSPLQKVFLPSDMNHLVSTLDEQPDVIPMRWLNAILGRIFYSFYQSNSLESFIIGRLMKKISKVKRPAILQDVVVTEVSVGNRTPVFSKPMLKELTKEGDASMEVHMQYKGEVRITVEATANISLGTRFKPYTVKLVLAAVMKECEGNLLFKIKRPPSNRIWYAFTQPPKMVLSVEPIVSDRQITWNLILSTLESKIMEVIQESVVLPNMDDISFFETLGLGMEHRGGIWSDAARRVSEHSIPGPSTEQPPPPEAVIDSSEDAPLPTEAVPETPKPLTTEQKSNSVADIQQSVKSDTVPLPSPSPASGSLSTSPKEDSASKAARRRSWFTHSRDNSKEDEPEAEKSSTTAPNDVQRGRGSDVSGTSRSQSTSSTSLTTPLEEDENKSAETLLHPHRSSSRHSSRSDREERSQTLTVPVSPRTPEPPSRASTSITTSTSPSSFFSSLKSRAAAADKQALGNTAREAMKKWSVNWGINNSPRKNTFDEADTGNDLSRPRTESLNGTLAQMARSSYAEMRAAVDERRNRTPSTAESSSPPDSSSRNGSQGSLPINIPTGRSKSISIPPSLGTGSNLSTGSSRSGTTVSGANGSDSEAREEGNHTSKPPPISYQPQAMTMSIPGIHASHKSAVQSMGYVAPSPPSPERQKQNPMLRLWKNSNAAASQSAASAAVSSVSGSPPEADSGDRVEAGSPLESISKVPSPTSSPSPPPNPLLRSPILMATSNGSPPKLPMRRPSSNASASISRPPLEPTTVKLGSDASSQSAEDKLKSIATKDESKRLSKEGAAATGSSSPVEETQQQQPVVTESPVEVSA